MYAIITIIWLLACGGIAYFIIMGGDNRKPISATHIKLGFVLIFLSFLAGISMLAYALRSL